MLLLAVLFYPAQGSHVARVWGWGGGKVDALHGLLLFHFILQSPYCHYPHLLEVKFVVMILVQDYGISN